jgi:hypothetical protein
VLTLSWVAPWTPGILKLPASHIPTFFELDASFRALKPYVYIVPTLVVANYGVPLGIVVTPTERATSYRLFWENIDGCEIQTEVYSRPLLSDKGAALIAYGEAHRRHWFCFRHILESLGSRTYVAILAHRLMFSASKDDYDRNHAEAAVALQIAISLDRVTTKGTDCFCRTFGFTVLINGSCVRSPDDPFEAEALWGERGRAGVSACTNHVEGLHGRLNQATDEVRLISRRLKRMVEVLWQKADRFSRDADRSAKRKFTQMVAKAKSQGYDCTECECGWNIVYAHRFGIDDFPCVHTCQQHPVDFQARNAPNLELSFDKTIWPPVCSDYDGTEWDFAESQASATPGQETHKNLPLGAEEPEDKPDADVDAFVRRLISELKMLNPRRASGLKVGNVAAEYGVFADRTRGTSQLDFQDASLKARFEIAFFGSDLK